MAEANSATLERYQAKTAAQEWRAHWPLVLSAMIGLSFGAVPAATLGLFMDPLQQDFGWSRAQIAAGMTIFAIVVTPLSPFAGALVDKFGTRRIAIPGMFLSALAFAAFSLMGSAYAWWIGCWVFLALATLMIRSTLWSRAVSGAFSTSRGMALAVLLCGFAISQATAPLVAHWFIENFGWRSAYVLLALCWGTVALALMIPWFHEAAPVASQATSPGGAPPALPGLTLSEAARNSAIWRIAMATMLQTMIGAAVAIHFIPLLIWSGLERIEAAGLAALLGIGSIAGKLITGWLIDRVSGGIVPFICFTMPALAYFLLWQGHGSLSALAVATLIVGYAGGASLHMTAYLTTRYAGLGHFGKIYGTIASVMSLGAGIGPLAAGIVYDQTQSYEMLLLIGMPLALLGGLLVAFLGPYPRFGEAGRID
jgi:predicted MFS family arabinose efflux permease